MIESFGYHGARVLEGGALPARVLGTWGDYYRIVCDSGEGIARKKRAAYKNVSPENFPTTGDFVSLQWNSHGESRILATLPRTSLLRRRLVGSEGRTAQLVAVNFDTLFFLMSANENFNVHRLERFLSLSSSCGAARVVLVTKCDLPSFTPQLLEEAHAVASEVPVFALSSRTHEGLAHMEPFLAPGCTLAFVGSSGVGKSSLVNVLAGEEVMPTCEIRTWDAKGRHATTERELIRLPSGALALDTPGLREWGLLEDTVDWTAAFQDVETLISQCRFSNCHHLTEPGCAVKEALQTGALKSARWKAYVRLQVENKAMPNKRASCSHRYRGDV